MRYRQGKNFVEMVDGRLETRESFSSVNAAKRANRQFKYPTLPEPKGVRYGRHVRNLGRNSQ